MVFLNFLKIFLFIMLLVKRFLHLGVYRNRREILLFFKKIYTFLLYICIFFIIALVNPGHYIHLLLFSFFEKSDIFVIIDYSGLLGLLAISASILDINYIIVYLYIIFSQIGLFKILSSPQDFYLLFGLNWIYFYKLFGLENCSIIDLIGFFIQHQFNQNNFDFFSILGPYPIFFYFGVLFFLSVVISWFFFSYLGLYGIFKLNFVTLLFFWLSLIFSFKSIFFEQNIFLVKLCSWVFLTVGVKIDYYFLFDTISFSFIFLTTTIALFVFLYAFSYFRYEPLVDRFLLFLLSFVISMIFLVSSGNTVMLFLGWELIGLTSFFLINFWTTKTATIKSAFKAFTFNKVSDFFLFMFLVVSYSVFYTFDILSINTQIYVKEFSNIYFFGSMLSTVELISLLLLGAAFIKSAQLGMHAWLPDSMEAPVPASSLIHSATLVSAGVYLILRFNAIFDVSQFSRYIIPVVGSLTAAYGGVCAAAQSDIKKTLAYSTISHCGFLMVLCSTEMNEFTILYLYVHGFFKAGVFMCVGNVLRITKGYQDTRRMGGLLKYLPFEYFCATIGLLNLAGLPFTLGFFIKHILLVSLNNNIFLYYFVIVNSLIGAVSGLFYSYKLITYTFCDFKKANKSVYTPLLSVNNNSILYTNSSLMATISIFLLFLSAYITIYFLFKYFFLSNYLFSDYLNTTVLTNYFSLKNSSQGFLINFSYLNVVVFSIIIYFGFVNFRKTHPNMVTVLLHFILFLLFFFLIYFIL